MYTTSRGYQSQAVETAGPAQLVLMLYDGALSALGRASTAPSPEMIHRELLKAQDIVTELYVTLDRERGGDVAAGLAGLYEFCLDMMVEANLSKDLSSLSGVTSVLTGLREAWNEAVVQGAA